jgi:hypothetical protein
MENETGATKRWEKPQLTIMVRSKPDEAVLVTCKSISEWLRGPVDTTHNYCLYVEECTNCSSQTAS